MITQQLTPAQRAVSLMMYALVELIYISPETAAETAAEARALRASATETDRRHQGCEWARAAQQYENKLLDRERMK